MKYISTRGSEIAKKSTEAIIQGIAEDSGLYVPEAIPKIPFSVTTALGEPYRYFAFEIIKSYFTDFTEDELEDCVLRAYDDKFERDEIAPVIKAGGVHFLELYHGPTAAFKDMALAIMPHLLVASMKKRNEDKRVCILTATSGDTGKAALEGFAGVPGTEIMVFYPKHGVSEIQERQMTTQEGDNTHVFAIEGNFDDAQAGVKSIFKSPAFAKELAGMGYRLSSANSINIGRLIPQVAYYVYGYAKLVHSGAVRIGEKINIVVPTGNFGNILAAYYAKEMGIPVNRLICASNKNNVLADFISTGKYDANRAFYLTNSPSMDILISSNLERLLFHLCGGDSAEINELMESLEKYKSYEVSAAIKEGLAAFYGGFADVNSTNETIGGLYKNTGYLMDTHTAVAYKVYADYRQKTKDESVTLVASTASPFKFAESVAASIGLKEGRDGFECIHYLSGFTGIEIPRAFDGLQQKQVRHKEILKAGGMPDAVKKTLAK